MGSRQTIAIFDFDGTLIRKDSLSDFLVFVFGYRGIILRSLPLVATLFLYACGFLSAQSAKEKILSRFIRGKDEKAFAATCEAYARERIPQIVREDALRKAKWHKARGHRLIIASASPENWILPWAKTEGFDEVIASKLQLCGSKLTGLFSAPNCAGEEKKRRFLKFYPERESYFLYVYTDSKKDQPLLSMADKAFFKRFV